MEARLPVARMAIFLPVGLLAVSIASILIRWCEAPALSIAAYRLVIASLTLVLLGGRQALARLTGIWQGPARWTVLSGFFLAIHFAAWIRSLELTSVAISVVLVSTAPFFAALGARLFLRARPSRLLWLGLSIAFIGLVMIARSEAPGTANSLAGNLLAVTGAAGGAGYMLIGRYIRPNMVNFDYILLTYSSAAVFLVAAAMLSGAPLWGFSGSTYLLLLAIAWIPQLIGHSSFNWALKYLSAPLVATIMLGEPVMASLLAYLLLGERLTAAQISGSLLILIGVGFAIWSETKQTERKQPAT